MKIQLELPLMAEVQTTALIICGTTATPERWKAITNGDCVAVPVAMARCLSSDGLTAVLRYFELVVFLGGTYTISPTMRILTT